MQDAGSCLWLANLNIFSRWRNTILFLVVIKCLFGKIKKDSNLFTIFAQIQECPLNKKGLFILNLTSQC